MLADTKPKWVTRAVQETDIDKISDFRAIIEGGKELSVYRSPEYYNWKYFDSPTKGEHQYARIAEDKGKIVGLLAATCKKMKVGERVIKCAEIGDIFTHPEYRRQGIFTTLGKELCAELEDAGISLIYVRPNENSYPGLVSKLYFEKAFYLKSMVLPLHVGKLLGHKMHLPSWFEKLIDRITVKVIYKAKEPLLSSEITISRVTHFDKDVSTVWESVSHDHDVMIVKDAAYLNWRYIRNPTDYVVLVAKDIGKTVGFIVFTTRVRSGYIVDILFPEERRDIAQSLLVRAINLLLQEGVNLVFAWVIKNFMQKPDTYYHVLRKFGFFPMGEYLNFVVRIISPEIEKISFLKTPTKWFLTMGDMDGI